MKNLKMRVLSLVLTLVMVLTGASFTNTTYGAEATAKKDKAVTFTVDGVKYKVTDAEAKEVQVTGAKSKKAKDVEIPNAVTNEGTTYFVTAIAAKAFKGMKKLEVVTVGMNVNSIGKSAFQGCGKMKYLRIMTRKLTDESVGKNATKGINKKAVIIVPGAKKEAYGFFMKKGQKKATIEAFDPGTVILYTNDVHCGVEDNNGYAAVSQLKKDLQADGNDVILVDNGDAVQGDLMGAMTKGDAIINVMNATGYDIAIPGNHDFDYGVDQFLSFQDKAKFEYISSNFKHNDELVLKPYVIKEAKGKKIAFIGVTTPRTYTSSSPSYFKDEEGNYIYTFSEVDGDDGASVCDAIQKSIDSAKAEGADYCILMAHLGVGREECSPYTSEEIIPKLSGLTAVLDGHSHTKMEGELIKDKDGNDVILTQAETKLAYVGMMMITDSGLVVTQLLDGLTDKDPEVTAVIDKEKAAYEEILKTEAGSTDFDLVIKDADGKRLIRSRETNLGDFCADAYRTVAGTDIGIMNGGGIRDNVSAGDITYGSLKTVHPFGNHLFKGEISGQTILDALEYSVYAMSDDIATEFGGFLQVSGITFDVNIGVETPVERDDAGYFKSIKEGTRRISNVKVGGEDLDPEKIYTIAGTDYTIAQGGDGYEGIFKGKVTAVDLDEAMTDMEVLIKYVESLGGKVPEEYKEPQNRINMINVPANTETVPTTSVASFEKLPTAA